jgi:hypothetical protein
VSGAHWLPARVLAEALSRGAIDRHRHRLASVTGPRSPLPGLRPLGPCWPTWRTLPGRLRANRASLCARSRSTGFPTFSRGHSRARPRPPRVSLLLGRPVLAVGSCRRPGSSSLRSHSPSRCPSNKRPGVAPVEWVVLPPLRLPLPGFLNPSAVSRTLELRGLVSCRNRVRVSPPSEVSPRRDRARLVGVACSLAVSPRTLPARSCWPCHRRFLATPPSFLGLAAVPRRLWVSFPRLAPSCPQARTRSTFPGRPGPSQPESPLGPASSASKPSSLCESVHARQSCLRLAVDPLLGFRPSGAFSAYALDPC